jgi:hypothetical protein
MARRKRVATQNAGKELSNKFNHLSLCPPIGLKKKNRNSNNNYLRARNE